MNFNKPFLSFAVLALVLASFSDCNRGESSKESSTKTDSSASVKQSTGDATQGSDQTPAEPQLPANTQDTSKKHATSQDPAEEMPKKGPLPRPLEPRWTGGDHEMMQFFFRKHVKYPEEARKNNIKGTVYVMFTVKATGDAESFKVRQGLGYGCDEEAIRVIKLMGKWQPGKVGGKEVDMEYSLGVPFEGE